MALLPATFATAMVFRTDLPKQREVPLLSDASSAGGYKECYNKALDLISRRAHFERELEGKLRKRGFLLGDVERTLERLRESGFLNEEETARTFVEARRRRLGEVGRRLEMELRKRGVDGDLAIRVVGEMDAQNDAELARASVERLRARGASDEKIGRHLSRKGFGKADILRVLAD